jgi:putative FmdB family regulatory protein
MPLYEYLCHGCGKKFEVIQKFSDEPLTTHPECGGAAEKLVSAPAFHLKGTGWYATDYAKSGSSTAPKKDEASSSSETKPAAAETKSESKDSTPAPAPTPAT